MPLSNGPLTPLLVASATSAGAGILLGGLVAGLVGVLRSSDGKSLDFAVRKAGYWGGAWGLVVLVLDHIAW